MSLHRAGHFRKMSEAFAISAPVIARCRATSARPQPVMPSGGVVETTEGAEPPAVDGGEQIRQREFATVRRGYDPAQVRSYLALVSNHVDALERSLADARRRVAALEAELEAASNAAVEPAIDPYEQISKRFANVLVTADSEAAHVVEQARAEAEQIKAEARARAEEARMRASQSTIAAREESDRMLANLAERRAAMLNQLHEMQSRLLSVAEDLEVAIEPSTRSTRSDAPSAAISDEPPELPDLSMLDFDLDDEPDPEH
jgi:DivIVA domain-containing protein